MMNKKGLVVCVLIIIAINGFSQEGSTLSPDRIATIEELYLQSGDMMIIRELAFVQDREMKLESLKMIESKIRDGSFAEGDPAAHFVLNYLAEEGTGRTIRVAGRKVNNFPMIRKEATRLLGELGGENARESLLSILISDPEMMVKSEAVYALGLIGLDNDNGEVARAIVWALQNQNQALPNDNFATASLYAIERMVDRHGTLNDREIYSAIVQIAQNSNYVRPVRQKALQVINKIRDSSR